MGKLENHHLFFDEDVPCEANTPLEEDRECCPKCDRKFITYFRYLLPIPIHRNLEQRLDLYGLFYIDETFDL